MRTNTIVVNRTYSGRSGILIGSSRPDINFISGIAKLCIKPRIPKQWYQQAGFVPGLPIICLMLWNIDSGNLYLFMKKLSLFAMAVLYVGAGINHFWHPELYLSIMPTWLPWHHELVLISGICELSLGLLLLFSSTRRIAAWGIILLLILVFPANIQMMLNYWNESNPNLWISIVRLPLQLLLIWWAYSFTKYSKQEI